jgi:hypothetical protein
MNASSKDISYDCKTLWLSLGENCLADDVLKRHGLKSFSTPYSSCLSNIDYALQLEASQYDGLLDANNLQYHDAFGKRVVRSIRYVVAEPIFHDGCLRGFEFTHHDPLGSIKDRSSMQRKVERMHAIRGRRNIIFLYHHRITKHTQLDQLIEKLALYRSIYSTDRAECFIALLRQRLVGDPAHRRMTVNTPAEGIVDYCLNTTAAWSGNDPELFWARVDDDLIQQMIQDITKRTRRFGTLAHDADWQYPAITEEHAYRCAIESLPQVEGVCYLGFPWATLIDRLWHGKDATGLLDSLKRLTTRLKPGSRVVTVCQHIRLLDHMHLLAEAGITDVFWSHAVRGQTVAPSQRQISVLPFPLYPVQVPLHGSLPPHERTILFSFVGARSEEGYLSRTREILFDKLGKHPRGIVRARDQWHYLETVYGEQLDAISIPSANPAEQRTKEEEYREVLNQSVFSLCPSGSGPNTLRLWESLGAGAIPVVLSDTWQPPGDLALWEKAVVFCGENEREIEKLPDWLEKLHRSPALLEKKREACRELWARYGPQTFITDLQEFFEKLASMPHEARGTAAAPNKPLADAVNLAADSLPQANKLYREGRYAEALQIYETLAAREPIAIYRDNARMARAKLIASAKASTP